MNDDLIETAVDAWLDEMENYATRRERLNCNVDWLYAAARAAIEAMGSWQPIATAPKDGTQILWYVDRGEYTRRRHGYEVVSWPRDKQCFEVGKWMPLPPPPEGE